MTWSIATFGRSFWILDNITPLRQAQKLDASRARAPWLYRPATAVRVDNDSFSGTPLPPEEPAAENPPNGAMIDYFLPSPASTCSWKFSMRNRISSDGFLQKAIRQKSRSRRKYLPLPVAERWFPKPEILEKTAGMHRFVWNLTWGSSGGPTADEDAEYHNPSGPKAVPGIYQVRLTVDGKTQSQSLKVVMDPRSPATPEILAQQLQLGQQIFAKPLKPPRHWPKSGRFRNSLRTFKRSWDREKSTNTKYTAQVDARGCSIRYRQSSDE